nr:putative reverse transcriptase domain-containing protein [Tanacetum cinerariifolium]
MSSASSAVTYTSIYTDSEPGRVFWGADEELSEGGSLRVIVYEYDRLPMLPVSLPSPDYIPGLEEPQTPPAPQDEHEPMFIQPHDHDFVPEPIYPEYIPLEDEHILPAEEQPLPPVVLPTAESLEYVDESNPEEDPDEYEDDEMEDGSDEDEEDEEEEEEENLAPTDSAVVIPTDELVSPPEGTEPVIPPPSTDTATTGARITRDCLKLKNKDGEKVNAPGWVYAVRNAEKRGNASRDPDSNVITENSYDVELDDGKIIGVDTIMRGCTLNFLNHPFNVDLMPVELGSFDIIIGMDWLRRCHAVIMCDEKLVQIPYGDETLTFCGNESNNRRESPLTVISCLKAQEYMAKGCQIFLAKISAKKEEDMSEGKQLEDVPVIWDYPEVFPKDLTGLPPTRPVEFQIDLIPGAAPVT